MCAKQRYLPSESSLAAQSTILTQNHVKVVICMQATDTGRSPSFSKKNIGPGLASWHPCKQEFGYKAGLYTPAWYQPGTCASGPEIPG